MAAEPFEEESKHAAAQPFDVNSKVCGDRHRLVTVGRSRRRRRKLLEGSHETK